MSEEETYTFGEAIVILLICVTLALCFTFISFSQTGALRPKIVTTQTVEVNDQKYIIRYSVDTKKFDTKKAE